jgi:hypothetical protein
VSGWSGAWSFTTVAAPPVSPVLASPINGAADQQVSLNLSWGTSALALAYEVEISVSSTFGSTLFDQAGATLTSASVSGLANGTTYYWRANASNVAGTSWANAWSFTTIIAAPAAPVLAAPTSGSVNEAVSLSLNWGTSAGATGYEVEVSQSSTFTSTLFDQTGASLTYATVSGLAYSTTYYWRANASNIGGTNWAAPWSFTTIIAAPGVPVLASPTNSPLNVPPVSLSLNWGSVPTAVSYGVLVSTNSSFGSTVFSGTGITGTTVAVSGLSNNVTYYYTVNASNAGGSGAWAAASNFVIAAVPVNAGWNCISFNMQFDDSIPTGAVFGNAGTMASWHYPKSFILVKTLSGRIYTPTLGIDDIDTLHTGEGYQMYTDSTDTVRAVGTAIYAPSFPISLGSRWNLFAYLANETQPITTQLAGIQGKILIIKNNAGLVYWPDYGIDDIDSMYVGQGYFGYMKSPATLNYAVAKRVATTAPLLRLPQPGHYAKHANTGNNASVLATRVVFGSREAPDSCEIGAYDGSGNLVGSGTVIHGLVAFPVWGQNTQTKRKDGLGASEQVIFKLWNKNKEYPAEFRSSDGSAVRYTAQALFLGTLEVPEAALITEFNLAKVYPNPFRGLVQVAFDVPTMGGVAEHNVEINIFNMKGILVHQLAHGKYAAGHYAVTWSGESMGGAAAAGSGIYVVQMKADNFDKRVKLVRVQ